MGNPTRLHLRYRRMLAAIRAATVRQALAADAAAAAVPLVLDGQRQVVRLADAYLSLEAGLVAGGDTAPWGLDTERLIGAPLRGGVPLEDVYGRNWSAVEASFAVRIIRQVITDLSLAERAASAVHTDGDPRVVGTRRVTSGSACELCSLAATRVYKASTLRPIHAHCSCTTQPIYERGPSPKVTGRMLSGLYERATGRAYDGPSRLTNGVVVAAVSSTDELGPTLTAA